MRKFKQNTVYALNELNLNALSTTVEIYLSIK